VQRPDPFDDLSKLMLTPEMVAAYHATAKPAGRRRARIRGEFYLAPVGWADRAAAAVHSSNQLILAFRLYRRWRIRQSNEDAVSITQAVLGRRGLARTTKRRFLHRLEAAGLIQVVSGGAGRAPRVRIIE
jgi:hypothetical protein